MHKTAIPVFLAILLFSQVCVAGNQGKDNKTSSAIKEERREGYRIVIKELKERAEITGRVILHRLTADNLLVGLKDVPLVLHNNPAEFPHHLAVELAKTALLDAYDNLKTAEEALGRKNFEIGLLENLVSSAKYSLCSAYDHLRGITDEESRCPDNSN